MKTYPALRLHFNVLLLTPTCWMILHLLSQSFSRSPRSLRNQLLPNSDAGELLCMIKDFWSKKIFFFLFFSVQCQLQVVWTEKRNIWNILIWNVQDNSNVLIKCITVQWVQCSAVSLSAGECSAVHWYCDIVFSLADNLTKYVSLVCCVSKLWLVTAVLSSTTLVSPLCILSYNSSLPT